MSSLHEERRRLERDIEIHIKDRTKEHFNGDRLEPFHAMLRRLEVMIGVNGMNAFIERMFARHPDCRPNLNYPPPLSRSADGLVAEVLDER